MIINHTPGPWWRDDDGFIASGHGDTYVTVADANCNISIDIAEREANTTLIAAAPDMFDALKALLDWAETQIGPWWPDCMLQAKDAIDKATHSESVTESAEVLSVMIATNLPAIVYQPLQNEDGNVVGHEDHYHTNFAVWRSRKALLDRYPNCTVVERSPFDCADEDGIIELEG